MKDEKEKLSGKRAVTCTPVDWNEYKVKKEEQSAAKKSRKEKKEWEVPDVGEKWAVDKKDLKMPADPEMKELKADNKPSKRKSLNAKLNELGNSNWVSTGNFRSEEDKGLDRLEDKIINEASGSQDEFLKSAMKVVSDALNEEGGEGKGIRADGLPEDGGVADTFEIPKLDIHFGDTAELKNIRQEIETIEKANIDKIVKERDFEAAIESQTAREITEREDNDRLAEIEKEGRKKKSKSKTGSKSKAEPAEEAPVKRSRKKGAAAKEDTEILPPEEDVPVKGTKSSKSSKSTKGTKKKSSRSKDPDKVVIKSEEVSEEEAAAAAAAKPKKKSSRSASGKKSSSKKSSAKEPDSVRKSSSKKGTKRKSSRSAAAEKYGKADKQAALDTVFDRKDGPSDFRRKSADWRDEDTVKKAERLSLITQKRQELAARIKKITPLQWGMAAMALVIFITGIMTSAVYANYQGEQNKASAIASLNKYKEDDSYREVATSMTEEMLPEAMDEPETTTARVLSLEMSSVEKDLKIKLVDEDDTLVKDVSWSVTVAEEGDDGDGDVYEDDDRDGTIYITDIAAGEYSVKLNPSDSLSDYILPQDKQLVSVKATIEYKVIANIKDEIKSEKEVNVALEDPNGNQAADVETGTALQDTVEWVESTKTTSGEEYVEATPDLSKLSASVKKENSILSALNRIGTSSRKSALGRSVLGFNLQAGYTVATNELEDVEIPSVAEFKISGSKSVKVGESIKLSVSADAGTVESWSTSKDGIVEILTNGNECSVKGVAEGTVDITARNSENSNTVTITVEKNESGTLDLDPVDITISGPNTVDVGSSITIKATCKETVSWSVSDSSIVTLKDNGDNSCSLKGTSAGKFTLTATCKDGDSMKSTSMEITVRVADENVSDSAQLYDSNKNPLYVKEIDGYRLATYGDYKSGNFSKYYRKQEGYLYTGWQNIDGKTYYYRSDHTYVTGEQVIQGIKYTFGSDGVLSNGTGTLGIDVSKYQPNINWSSVKASGVNFVIIRCGYRGASTGALIQDPYFTSHIKGAKAAGLKVGVYFFTTALNETEAVEEASMCAALCSGYGINYPIFMDCENSSRPGYNSMSASERTAIIKAFCSTIKSAGYTPGVYANKTWFTEKINASALSGCKIWLAQYNAGGPTYSGRYDIWQYTSKGHVDGIPGNVDMNQSYLGY